MAALRNMIPEYQSVDDRKHMGQLPSKIKIKDGITIEWPKPR
jgi:hypothetical protein